ncbi:diflavin oxidoreductase [Suttonella ornithocola]|uniref:Sulfite reductase [NADPH] flavoprotein alpha-component n=1 Tax=Suttonella ornithocola TaxID=279832 RepID=A0A380MXG2_9GAMM|nr:sulfite reductase flavoprotein subunit alpha [Suttonella ornithocola]SUO96968.1 Sulfite reductase [NADPH] flavoprotein alpha-component [Suttonella ornithocola]
MSEKTSLTALLPADLPFSEGQKQWLDGYLAGLKSAYLALRRNIGDNAQSQLKPLTILYGSQTGNAAMLAQDCAEKAKAYGLHAFVKEMDAITIEELPTIERLLIITSTYGEGEMPDNAESLWERIEEADAIQLPHTHYSVLAIGDSSYEHFCLAGKKWDHRLAELGAERLSERVDCDVDFEEKAAQWMDSVLPAISEKGSQTTVNGAPSETASVAKNSFSRRNPLMAKLKTKRLLSSEQSGKQIFHYEISLIGSGETYEAGDILNLMPQNKASLIEELLTVLKADKEEIVSWQGSNYSLLELLRDKLEIRLPSREFYEALLLRVQDEHLHAHFSDDTESTAEEFLYGKDIVDLLSAYPEATFSAQELVDVLKPLAPRAYSISSSHDKHPDEVHLTIGAVRYTQDEREHHGVASTWLADDLAVGDIIPCYFSPNKHFSIPANPEAPMIMVGPGTGIAPFRAFLEAREMAQATGENWLFFGDRTREHDFIYADELNTWLESGHLTRLDLAFSRDQAEKIYVQDKMREHGEELFAWLERGGYFFVCGDALRMAKDVDAALHEIIAKHGNLSAEETETYIAQLKKDKRYVRDVY